jgi:hypothetical protein
MKYIWLPTIFSWYDIAVYSKLVPGASVRAAISSINLMACPLETPAAGTAITVAEG